MPLKKYTSHITHTLPIALLLWSTQRPQITTHTSPKTSINNRYSIHYCQICARYKYASQMPHILISSCVGIRQLYQYTITIFVPTNQMPYGFHICLLFDVQIPDNYVSIYTSYQLTKINNATRNAAEHTFHITSICPYTNMPARSHMYAPLHYSCSLYIDPKVLHTSVKNQCGNISLSYYCKIWASSKYAPQMP